jgi:hypothetical protein
MLLLERHADRHGAGAHWPTEDITDILTLGQFAVYAGIQRTLEYQG